MNTVFKKLKIGLIKTAPLLIFNKGDKALLESQNDKEIQLTLWDITDFNDKEVHLYSKILDKTITVFKNQLKKFVVEYEYAVENKVIQLNTINLKKTQWIDVLKYNLFNTKINFEIVLHSSEDYHIAFINPNIFTNEEVFMLLLRCRKFLAKKKEVSETELKEWWGQYEKKRLNEIVPVFYFDENNFDIFTYSNKKFSTTLSKLKFSTLPKKLEIKNIKTGISIFFKKSTHILKHNNEVDHWIYHDFKNSKFPVSLIIKNI